MKSPTPSPISQAAGERDTVTHNGKDIMQIWFECNRDVFTFYDRITAPTTGSAPEYIATLPSDWHVDSSLATWFPLTAKELESATRMFHAACHDLGLINEALGLDPDDGGAEPILDAIAELRGATPNGLANTSAEVQVCCDRCNGAGVVDAATPASPVASVLTDGQIKEHFDSHARYALEGSKLYWDDALAFARALLAASMGGDKP